MNPNDPADMRTAILHGLRNAMAPTPVDRLARSIHINPANDVFLTALRKLVSEANVVCINRRYLIPGQQYPATGGAM